MIASTQLESLPPAGGGAVGLISDMLATLTRRSRE